MAGRLNGKVAVVTGAGGLGIGQGCALMFAREGAHVVGCDINQAAADETLAIAKAEGLSYESYIGDLTDPATSDALMQYAVDRFGGLNILVTAAAFVEFAPIEEFDYEKHWKRTLQGELDLVFLPCKAAWNHIKASGGGSMVSETCSSPGDIRALIARWSARICGSSEGSRTMRDSRSWI